MKKIIFNYKSLGVQMNLVTDAWKVLIIATTISPQLCPLIGLYFETMIITSMTDTRRSWLCSWSSWQTRTILLWYGEGEVRRIWTKPAINIMYRDSETNQWVWLGKRWIIEMISYLKRQKKISNLLTIKIFHVIVCNLIEQTEYGHVYMKTK